MEIFGYFGKLRLFIKVHLSSLINFKACFSMTPTCLTFRKWTYPVLVDTLVYCQFLAWCYVYMHFQLWIYLWNKNRDVSLILKSHLIRVIPLHRKILNVSWHIMNIHIDYIWRYNDLLKISMILKHSLVFIHLYTHISNKQKSSLCTHGYIQLIQDFFI